MAATWSYNTTQNDFDTKRFRQHFSTKMRSEKEITKKRSVKKRSPKKRSQKFK